MKRLKQAAVDTDMEKVDHIVVEIRAIKPELAESPAALADEFEYGKIVESLEKNQETNA